MVMEETITITFLSGNNETVGRGSTFTQRMVVQTYSTYISDALTDYSLTCKYRKLKCDESRPSCGRCELASRTCEYSDNSIFRQFDVQKPNHRIRPRDSDDPGGTFGDDDVWVKVPRKRKAFRLEHNQVTYCFQLHSFR